MIRILQLEDDPDILEICEMALGMEEDLVLLQCTSGDEAIAKALEAEDGIKIARRTVTKYRKALELPSSTQRKQY